MQTKFSARNFVLTAGGVFLSLATIVLLIGGIVLTKTATGNNEPYSNTITVSGASEIFAVPDIAEMYFTVTAEADTVDVAQVEVNTKSDAVMAALIAEGIAENDIQTSNYSANPRYEWPDNQRTLAGYQVSHSVTVKIRDLEQVGDVIGLLGQAKVENLGGPNFRIEDQDAYKADAREEAIMEAQMKAKELASQLGVKLGKVVGFWEDEYGSYPEPYMTLGAQDFAESSVSAVKNAPNIAVGENRVQSRVNITYKIK